MRSDPRHQRKESEVRPPYRDVDTRAQERKRSSTVTGAGETSVTYDECDEQWEVLFDPSPEFETQVKGAH